mmetsp:Transcript_33324/g.33935  ORF Transcript_33324/g.33935 Transcript_33324/m.33935 type:complete len:334 (-) Transcript_33324:98-1099(-)
MGRLNNFMKWMVMHINLVSFIFAWGVVIIAAYVMASEWGDLDSTFFSGWGAVMVLFGISIMLVSLLGCYGVYYQVERKGYWTGRRIIAIYLCILFAALIGELYVVVYLSSTINSLRLSQDSLKCVNCEVLSYDEFEIAISKRFNDFYFAGIKSCGDSKFNFFWDWIRSNCPGTISYNTCERCQDYTIRTCQASEEACYQESGEYLSACPYDICREPVLAFLIRQIGPLSYFTIAFTGFQILLMTFGCCLCCYTEKQTEQEMKIRNSIAVRRRSQLDENGVYQRESMYASTDNYHRGSMFGSRETGDAGYRSDTRPSVFDSSKKHVNKLDEEDD